MNRIIWKELLLPTGTSSSSVNILDQEKILDVKSGCFTEVNAGRMEEVAAG